MPWVGNRFNRIWKDEPKTPDQQWPTEKILPSPKDFPSINTFSRTITATATDKLRIPIIYGKVRTGAIIVWEKPLSNGNWLAAYLIGWGPIQSVGNMKLDNESLATFGITSYVYLGNTTTNAAANTRLTSNDSGWTSRLPGLAYVVLEIPNPASLTDGKAPDPHSFVCDVSGLLVPDHRSDPTLATLAFSENVAVCRADYWTNRRYGRGRPINMIDYTTVDAAANECDHDIGGGKKRFKIGIKLGPEKSKWSENDRKLRIHAQMWDSFSQGKWQMFVDVDQTPSSLSLIDVGPGANIISAYLRDKEPEECYNYVEFTYTDQANEYKPGTAATSDPGIGNGTINCIYQANFQTDGSPDFDQSKRLSVWAFNRAKLDKEYVLEVMYDGGVKCVPGLVVPVTSADIDVSGQLMIIKTVEDIDDLSFTVTCELFSHATYSDTIQTTSAIAPPAGPSPFGPLPAPTGLTLVETADQVDSGAFIPAVVVSFTPYTGSNAGGTRITKQIGGGTVVECGVFGSSPIRLLCPDGIGNTVTIKAYSVDVNTKQSGAAFSSSTMFFSSFFLTNSIFGAPSEADGSGTDLSGANGLVKAFSGATDISSTIVVGTVVATNCTGTCNTATNTPVAGQPKGYYRVTAITADNATLDIPVTIGSVSVVLRFDLSKKKKPTKILKIITDRTVLNCERMPSGSLTPTDIFTPADLVVHLSTVKQNTTATVSWSAVNGSGASGYMDNATGDTNTMTTNWIFGLVSTGMITVTATLTDGAITLTDSITLRLSTSPLSYTPACVVYKSTGSPTSTGSGFLTAVTFDTEQIDNGTFHSTTVNTSRISFTANGYEGQPYRFDAQVAFDFNSNGTRFAYIRKNGTTIIATANTPALPGSDPTFVSVSVVDTPAFNDYYEVCVMQDSGFTINVLGTSTIGGTTFRAHLL